MRVPIFRPDSSFTDEKWLVLQDYITEQWRRAKQSRQDQVDNKFERWSKNYYGVPREKVRTVPWYKSSNFVVKIIRMFVDTFVARTLNMIFATQPMYTCEAFPREYKDALQYYLNRKATGQWQHYQLVRDLIYRGNRTGTAVIKSPYIYETDYVIAEDPMGMLVENEVVTYDGPRSRVIPFDDFYVYPITADRMEDVEIKFHVVRYTEEKARRVSSAWRVEPADLELAIKMPQDIKRASEQLEAGLSDPYLRTLQLVEVHLKWPLGPDESKLYNAVALFLPDVEKLVDLYFYPLPTDIFGKYCPYEREDMFYGESMVEVFDQIQEEISQIHNDRRNNSFIASAPVFKRKAGARVPNPSTNWYPGKVFDLEEMDDFEVMDVGRNIGDLLAEENHVLTLGERLSGIGPIQQGQAQGVTGKRGVYNTGGVMAIMGESNQRQDTNIRDVRSVLGDVAKRELILQLTFGKDDPMIAHLPKDMQSQVQNALANLSPEALRFYPFEVKASNAGLNREIERQNLMALQGVILQYGQISKELVQALVDPQLNQGIRIIINDILRMHKWVARRLLRAFDEQDVEGILPNDAVAVEAVVPGGSRGSEEASSQAGLGGMGAGGPGGVPGMADRASLEALAALPTNGALPSFLPGMEGGGMGPIQPGMG